MRKLFTAAIFLLAIGIASAKSPFTLGETFYITDFQDIGYNDFVVEGANKRGCMEVKFIFPDDKNKTKELFPLLYLAATFEPVAKGDARVEIKINDFNITTFGPSQADCSESRPSHCNKLIFLPKENLREETNRAEICLQTSNTITKISISKSGSLLALHTSPKFLIETIPEKREIVLGETLKVRLVARNTGSANGMVEFKRTREVAEDKNAFRVVDGDTSWEGILEPSQRQEIVYTIKPKAAGPLSLPPAVLTTRNIVGEKETLFSEPVMLLVRLPEKAIEAQVIKKRETARVNEKTGITIVVKNRTEQKIENVLVGLLTDLEGAGGTEKTIALQPNQAQNIEFFVTARKAGTASIGCNVKYSDARLVNVDCEKQNIVFEEQTIPALVIIGLFFIAIAITAYAYIHYSK